MTDEKGRGDGSIRRRPSDLVMATVVLELVGLALCGAIVLVAWPFGWLPDSHYVALMTAMFAAKPAGELYREGPPRRLAAAAALLSLITAALLVAAAADWVFPTAADHDLDFLAGFLIGTPVGAAVFAWFYNRANVA
ncbi:hypothetical protein [Streptomyces canus]|uniref:hypothetical protein n=1 Tax=Streptomyces canus TaxID=58343 RepID=UPI0027856798|nr:hypothetical protein [Streptomyces canus]MDQ0761984.1 hypothetical protein [Streptomyces canus]